MRVLVCGGRYYALGQRVYEELDRLHASPGGVGLVLHGGCRTWSHQEARHVGSDHFAGMWADARGVKCRVYPAEWRTHGKAATPIRNAVMLAHGRPHVVVALPGGRGTANMIMLARAASVPVVEVPP